MPGESPFLTTEDLELFNRPGRFLRRDVVPKPLDPHDADSVSEDITSLAVNSVKAVSTNRTNSFRCHCVSVRTDDGMSWTAESVRQRIISECPHFAVMGLSKRQSPDVPHITNLLGERGLLQAAVKHKLAKWYPTLYISHAALALASLGAIGLLVAIGNAVQKMETPAKIADAVHFKSPLFLSVTIVLTALGVISKILADRFSPGQKAASLKQLKDRLIEYEKLAADHQAPRDYSDFVEELARKLQRIEKPRAVIIDNYERLDPTSRAVIEQYFRAQRSRANGSEYWLILELPDGQNFSHLIAVERDRYEQDKFTFYKQLPLSAKALHELAQALNFEAVPPGSTVKWVCGGGIPQNNNSILTLLHKYREDHPADSGQYGDLEFFYLLSIASTPMEMAFTRNQIVKLLIEGKQRLKILEVLLRNTTAGTERSRSEFELRLANIQREFSPFLESTARNELRFNYEPAKTLEANAASFGLKDASLVHLYWAFYWFDSHQNAAPQAFVLRKLNYHLLRASLEGVPTGLLKPLINHAFDAFLEAIDKSVKTCLFADLPALVAKAAIFYGMKDREERGNSQDRLLRRCWDTFSVLGDEQTLTTILKLREIKATTTGTPEITMTGGELTDLFLAAVPMDQESKDAIGTAFRNWAGRRSYENGQAAMRNAAACAGWLITSIVPLADEMSLGSTLLGRAFESCSVLCDYFRETYAKLERQKSSVPMLTDVMTLSLCLWSEALQLETQFSLARLELLAEMAHEALIVATELKDRTSGPNMEAVVNGLSRELAAVALASLLTGYTLMRESSQDQAEAEAQITGLVSDGLTAFGRTSRSTAIDLRSTEILTEVDSLLSLGATIWIRFGLDRLRDFAYLRRLQFNFICRRISPDDHARTYPLLETVSPALAGRGMTSVLSNISVAGCLSTTNELSTRYLNRAALITFNDEFDWGLQNGMAIMTICHGHALGLNLEQPLKVLLREDSNGRTFLRNALVHLPSSFLSVYALRFLNVTNKLQNQTDAREVEDAVFEAASLMPKGNEQTEVLSLLELHKLERQAQSGEVLPSEEELLAAWVGREQSWMFAAVIKILVDKGHPKDEHWALAHSLLAHDPSTDPVNSYHMLAMTVGEHDDEIRGAQQQRTIVLRYLQGSLTKWERRMPVESNLRAYQLLTRLDETNRATYYSGLMKWEKIKIERDHLSVLPDYVRTKKYYLIFNEYYWSSRFWGLESDGSREQWHEFRRADVAQRKREVDDWINDGAEIPSPLQGRDKSVVSARFLWLGHRLFSPPFYDDLKYQGDRERFDKAAMNALKDLREAILRLPNMPREIRELLAYHSRQLLSYDGLIDGNKRLQ